MTLQIRNPRAHELARELSELRGVSMSDAVVQALEQVVKQERARIPLRERVKPIIDRLHEGAQPGGRAMTKEEIDAMWGHEG